MDSGNTQYLALPNEAEEENSDSPVLESHFCKKKEDVTEKKEAGNFI